MAGTSKVHIWCKYIAKFESNRVSIEQTKWTVWSTTPVSRMATTLYNLQRKTLWMGFTTGFPPPVHHVCLGSTNARNWLAMDTERELIELLTALYDPETSHFQHVSLHANGNWKAMNSSKHKWVELKRNQPFGVLGLLRFSGSAAFQNQIRRAILGHWEGGDVRNEHGE